MNIINATIIKQIIKPISNKLTEIDYKCKYPLTSIFMLFFIFSFIGWLSEIGFKAVTAGIFVNRGVLHGLWLPIYGVGGILILLLLKRFRNNPFLTFGMGMVICGIVEYIASWCLEFFFHATWWDYSNEFMNIDGRICLKGLLIFGAAGNLIIYVAAPLINQRLLLLSKKIKVILCIMLMLLFAIDFIISIHHPNMGKGISLSTM